MIRTRLLALSPLLLLACTTETIEEGASSSGSTNASSGTAGEGGAGGEGGSTTNATSSTSSTSASSGSGGDPWAGPLESLAELDLGTREVGGSVSFPVPDRTLGFTTFSTIANNAILGLDALRPPTGASVIYNYAVAGTGLQSFVDEGLITGANPLSDAASAVPMQSGAWRLWLGSDAPGRTARTRIFVRRTQDGGFHGGVIDVNVLVAPGVSSSSQTYLTNVVQRMFDATYGPLLGLQRGQLSFASLPSSATSVSGSTELRQLLSSTSGVGAAPALNLLVVGSFTGDLGQAQGVAGGIPGTPMVHGTPRSGVAFIPTGNQNYDASVLAHEVGHLAGLFHTTEIAVTAADPLSDTPTCANIGNTNPNNCPDVSNVMFPIAYGGSVLSEGQTRVVRGSAIYRGILSAGASPSGPLSDAPISEEWAARRAAAARDHEAGEVSWLEIAAPNPSSELERLLGLHVCPLGPDGSALDVDESLARIAASIAGSALDADLLRIAADAASFDVARARALALYARRASSAAERASLLELLRAVVADPGAPTRTTLRAIELLAAQDRTALETHRDALLARGDRVVRERLRELGF